MKIAIQTEQEDGGRWIAEVVDLARVAVYGAMREEAIHAAQALALGVVADRLEKGEQVDKALLDSVFVAA
jgi:predicted RNase H-like HicB family nuclease